MSHQETLERMNAELNTADTWARRWQVERELNERLNSEAHQIRTGIHDLKARAVERYTNNKQNADASRIALDPKRAELYDRAATIQSARARALDDILELMDAISRRP